MSTTVIVLKPDKAVAHFQVAVVSVNRLHFLYFVFPWQHFSDVFVGDLGTLWEEDFASFFSIFCLSPKGLTLRSELPGFPVQPDGPDSSGHGCTPSSHLSFPLPLLHSVFPSFYPCLSLSASLYFSCAAAVMTHCSCCCHGNDRLLTWPASCLQSALSHRVIYLEMEGARPFVLPWFLCALSSCCGVRVSSKAPSSL